MAAIAVFEFGLVQKSLKSHFKTYEVQKGRSCVDKTFPFLKKNILL